MNDTPLQRRRLCDIEEAIQRAKDYAAAQEIPLTVERLAAEMDMSLQMLHGILEGEICGKSRGMTAKIAAIRSAAGEATASVMEHAMRRGSGANMHMLYLKHHAGYDEKGKGKQADTFPPVVFMGEEDILD